MGPAGQPLQQGGIDLIGHFIVGAVASVEHHLAGVRRGMALESGAASGRIDPGVPDAPEQQQRRPEFGEQFVEGLAARDVEHGAEHPEGTGIERGTPDRLHQLLIDVGAVDVHLVEGAPDRGGSAQILKQQPLQHGALEQGAADAAPGDRPPAAAGGGLIAERPGGIDQHHAGGLLPQGHTGGQGGEAAEGVAHHHRGTTDALVHVGHQLIAPERPAIGGPSRLGAAAKAEQVEGMHLMTAGQHRNVVAPMVCGGPEAMHQQHRRTLRPFGPPAEAVHRVSPELPGLGGHGFHRRGGGRWF